MSVDSSNIVIRGDRGERIDLCVHSYERAEAENIEDANWLVGSVGLSIGSVQAEASLSIRTWDLKEFGSLIQDALLRGTGEAALKNLDETISVAVRIDDRGAAHVLGILCVRQLGFVTIRFDFESDRTFLQETALELSEALKRFPPRERSLN